MVKIEPGAGWEHFLLCSLRVVSCAPTAVGTLQKIYRGKKVLEGNAHEVKAGR